MMQRSLSMFLAVVIASLAAGQDGRVLMRAPSGERYVERNETGASILPNGRFITPDGPLFRVKPHPYGLTMSQDGRWVVTVSSDGPQLSILDLADPDNPKIASIPEHGESAEGVLDACFMGAAIGPDNRTLYVAGGGDWSLMGFDLETRERLFRMDCAHESEGQTFEHGYLGDLRLTRDGKTIYAVDQSNFRMLIIDVEGRQVVRSIGVGRYPFGIALSPDETRAYIANVGMYEYVYFHDEQGNRATLDFPPYGMPSEAAVRGTTIDGVTAPALGDPNDIRGMSVWTVDISERGAEQVIAKTKSGRLVGEQLEDFPAVGGSSPNSIAATATRVYVSNGSNDSITVIDAQTGRRVQDIHLVLDERVKHLRGMIPFGLALSPDQKVLYVCEAGVNSVAAIDLERHTVIGRVPTAWFPSKLAVSNDGKTLYVACAKGLGSGPNAGPGHDPNAPTSIGALMYGYLHAVALPQDAAGWRAASQKVVANNVEFYGRATDPRRNGHPVPPTPRAWRSPIKHVIFVTKENRTYDEIYGAMEGGRGSEEWCRLGKPIDVSNKDGSRTVKDVVLMPNHLALAKRFAMTDNFYCDSDHSTDGHRWLVNTYPNEFVEAKIGQRALGDGPGNALFIGSSGAVYPEDYNEAGSIWEHFDRNGIAFFNFGLGFEFKPQDQEQEYKYTGIRLHLNYPMPQPLFENTSRKFATYNTNIPDQFRMDMFEEEFNEKWVSGKEPFPQVITMMLPNDHGASERPDDGYPFWGSYMSDNDLALGRLVELISNSRWWKETVIFVTEDDAQGYRDTVDAHRSICLVISPYAKPGYISHTHSNFGSIMKTMFSILALPALNQYDAFASDLADMFLMEPSNDAPYRALPVNAEIFDPQKAFTPFDREFNWEALHDFVPLDHQDFLNEDEYGHSGQQDHTPR
jgi:YVTN family beta-propeller protein